ncbi:MAG: hypothetical protein QF464_02475 [Myxococcota bacterium]|nr:hypothetical protein [Myxococcota bacterium]
MRDSIFGLALGATLVVSSPALATAMGLGPDARESVEQWSGRLGQTVESITLTVDHAAVDVGDCVIVLAHETGSRCSGLHMDAGGARACLVDHTCMAWSDFQSILAKAGPIHPPWRTIEVITAAPQKGSEAATGQSVPEAFEAALRAAEMALVLLDRDRARHIFNALLDRDALTLAQQMRFLPGVARLGLGSEALSRLGTGKWLEADTRLATVVRFSLAMGPSAGVAVADALLDEAGACAAVAIGQAFALVGDHAAAAALGRVLRRKDVKCLDAYVLEVEEGDRAGERQAVADAFFEARGRFPGDVRLAALEFTALRATGQWLAAKYLLDKRLDAGRARPVDLTQLQEVVTHGSLKASAKIAWTTRLEAAPTDPIAAFLVGSLSHQEGDYSRSFTLLELAAKGLPGEVARLHTLQALNAFRLGDLDKAKRELARSLDLGPKDYQGHWAAAEILRDTDLFAARRSLDIALSLLPHRAMPSVRMKRQRTALLACDGSAKCKGPWRY